MKRLSLTIIIVLMVLLSGTIEAGSRSGGTRSVFSIGAGSRAIALGGAFVAVGDDPSVLFYNPAGLRNNRVPRVMINHIQLFSGFSDASYDFAGVVYPTLSSGSIGLAFMTVGTGGIRGFDEFSRETGELSYRESQGILSYAVNLPWVYAGRVSIGASVKILHQRVGDFSDTGTGLDIGFLYSPPIMNGLVFGCNLQDIVGAETKLVSVSERVDRTLMFGVGYRYLFKNGSTLTLSGQMNVPERDEREVRFGAEFNLKGLFGIRIGYDSEQVTAGVGFALRGFQLDYGFFSREDAGSSHPITLSASFGSSLDERLRIAEERRKKALEEYVRNVVTRKVSEHINKANAYRKDGDLEKALDELKIVLEYDPSNDVAQELIGEVRKEILAKQEELTRNREKALLINQHFKLGLKYYSNNDYILARAEWRHVLELDPANEKAKEYLAKTEEKLNEQISIHRLKAKELERKGMLTAALSEWNLVRMIDPENAEAVEATKRIDSKLEKLRKQYQATSTKLKSVELFESALKLYSSGDFKGAIDKLKELLKINPGHEEAKKLLARAQRKITPLAPEEKKRIKELYISGMKEFTQDNYRKAIEYWKRILDIDPDNESVRDNIEEAMQRLKKMEHGSKKK